MERQPRTEAARHAAHEAHKAQSDARAAYVAAKAAGAPHDEVITAHTRWVQAAMSAMDADAEAHEATMDADAEAFGKKGGSHE
jgi:hypothetical protein